MKENERMRELVSLLNRASKAYYMDAQEIMTDHEYDQLYDELLSLEQETGIILSCSPTHHVGYEVVSELPKERHPSPMQSLDKTKSPEVLKSFLGNHEGILSWKLDGLTIVLTYEKGQLVKAVTRGNGEVGELITQNVKQFSNIPLTISECDDRITIRGEAVISYKDFERINSKIPEVNSKYKNPRNLCSGTVRQLNSEIVKQRNVRFIAFELVSPTKATIEESYRWMREQGFDVVACMKVDPSYFDYAFSVFKERLLEGEMFVPTDGLVLRYNDYAYGESLGRTDKFPRHSLAFKWADETAPTTLLDVEWSTSRTGIINPVAVFEPVELEGTTVERATLHNVSIIEQLKLGIGDEITVYKANMIIPKIEKNLTQSGTYQIPERCPECGGEAVVKQDNGSKILYCTNPDCHAKLLAKFTHFVSQECMNIVGLSEATLEKMINSDLLHSFNDLYGLKDDSKAVGTLMKYPGLGRTSVNNILDSIEESKKVTLDRFINSLGIPGIGKKQAKQIAKEFNYDVTVWRNSLSDFDFRKLDGFGDVLQKNIHEWFDHCNQDELDLLIEYMQWQMPEGSVAGANLDGKVFVITGKVKICKNRKELQEMIENAGGKVADSVSAKTNYLVNNDVQSTSGKNKKAKELGVPIISEEELIQMI